jgi:6-pyruvoyltetrahydropterin 2'-reductase
MIQLTEAFYSIQGEGLALGTPSVFIRTTGCNFQCRGFGMPKGELSHEADNIDHRSIAKIEDIPMLRTGCDSAYSWNTKFKHLWKRYTEEELAEEIKRLLPTGDFRNNKGKKDHLVITGGEPLLGWQKSFAKLFELLPNLPSVTFETNGTQMIKEELIGSLDSMPEVLMSVSPKLSASGEKFDQAIKPDVLKQYWDLNLTTYLKFVIDEQTDLEEIERAIDAYGENYYQVFLMPAGSFREDYQRTGEKVWDFCMKNGYRYSPRLHIDVKGNEIGI